MFCIVIVIENIMERKMRTMLKKESNNHIS